MQTNPKWAMIALLFTFGIIYLIANAPPPPTPYKPDWQTIQEANKFTLTNTHKDNSNKTTRFYLYYKDNEGYEVKELIGTLTTTTDKYYHDIEATPSPYFREVKDHTHTTIICENGGFNKVIPSNNKYTHTNTELPPNPNRLPKKEPNKHLNPHWDSPWIK